MLLLASVLASCGTVPKTTVLTIPEGPPLASLNDSLYEHVLERAVAASGAVDYSELSTDTDLTSYLNEIARVQPDALPSRGALLAFWINTHNAYVLDLIRKNWDGGAVRSIDDIAGFRYANVIIAGGKRYSLDGIEHEIIEKQFREPRAFFALFNGSISSPRLQPKPYVGAELSDELDGQLKGFLADSTKNYLDRKTNTLYLSRIFTTYAGDLEQAAGGALADFVRLFAPAPIAQWIARHPNLTISNLRYDYSINTNNSPPTHEQYSRKPPRRPDNGIR